MATLRTSGRLVAIQKSFREVEEVYDPGVDRFPLLGRVIMRELKRETERLGGRDHVVGSVGRRRRTDVVVVASVTKTRHLQPAGKIDHVVIASRGDFLRRGHG